MNDDENFDIQQETEDQYQGMVIRPELESEMVEQDNRVMDYSS